MNLSKYKSLLIFLIVFAVFNVNAQTPYFGIGGALTLSKINFTSSDGKKNDYKSQLNFSQNLSFGYNTNLGFASELNFGNTFYSGINESINHELSLNQIQTSILLGYVSPGKFSWGILTGVYYGKITNLRSIVDGKSLWEATEPFFDKNDFGSSTKLFMNFKKEDSRFLFSPNLVLLFGLKNLENHDQSLKQTTKLNSFMLGMNIKYQITK